MLLLPLGNDYCNALNVGLSQSTLAQLAHNASAWLLTGSKKQEKITPVLKSLQ